MNRHSIYVSPPRADVHLSFFHQTMTCLRGGFRICGVEKHVDKAEREEGTRKGTQRRHVERWGKCSSCFQTSH